MSRKVGLKHVQRLESSESTLCIQVVSKRLAIDRTSPLQRSFHIPPAPGVLSNAREEYVDATWIEAFKEQLAIRIRLDFDKEMRAITAVKEESKLHAAMIWA